MRCPPARKPSRSIAPPTTEATRLLTEERGKYDKRKTDDPGDAPRQRVWVAGLGLEGPGVDPENYTSFDAQVRYAQAAEPGKFAFLFLPDFLGEQADLTRESLMITLEPMMTLAAIARETERIGLVATGSTTFNEPLNIARQFKALDVMSHGRVGWNAVTTSDPAAAANYGQSIAPRPQRYQRAHETIQITQALWGSWQRDAWVKDTAPGHRPHQAGGSGPPRGPGWTHRPGTGPLLGIDAEPEP